MAVAYEDSGTFTSGDGTTALLVPPPATATAASLQLLHVLYKLDNDSDISDYTIPDIEGWNLLFATGSGVSHTGADTGFVAHIIYWKSKTLPETVEVPVMSHTVVASAACQTSYTYATDHVYLIPTGTTDSTHGANVSFSTQTFEPPDNAFVAVSVGLTSAAGSISGDTITYTDGSVTGTTVRVNGVASEGDNVRLRVVTYSVTDPGTATEYSHTNASSNSGSAILIHIGEVSGITPLRHTNTDLDLQTGSTGLSLRYRGQSTGNLMAIMVVGSSSETGLPSLPSLSPTGWTTMNSVAISDVVIQSDGSRTSMYYQVGLPENLFSGGLTRTEFGITSVTISNGAYSSGIIYVLATEDVWNIPQSGTGSEIEDSGLDFTVSADFDATSGDVLIAACVTGGSSGSIEDIAVGGLTFTEDNVITESSTPFGSMGYFLLTDLSGTQTGGTTFSDINPTVDTPVTGMVAFVSVVTAGTMTLVATAPSSHFSTIDSRYTVTASNIDTDTYTKYNILRISTTGAYLAEFLASEETLDTTNISINDYEFHFAAPSSLDEESHYYQMDLFAGSVKLGSLTSNTVTPHTTRAADPQYQGATSPSTWIKKISSTGNQSQPVTISEFSEYTRQAKILGEYDVLGNPYPVIITDVMRSKTGQFSLLVYHDPAWIGGQSSLADITELETLFDSGETLYFQTIWPALSGIQDFYFMVRQYTVERLSRHVLLHDAVEDNLPIFKVTVEYSEQERPAEQGNIAPLTWESLLTNYSTWAGMSAANTSWLDVLSDA